MPGKFLCFIFIVFSASPLFSQEAKTAELPAFLNGNHAAHGIVSIAEAEQVRGKFIFDDQLFGLFTYRDGQGLKIEGQIGTQSNVFAIAPIGNSLNWRVGGSVSSSTFSFGPAFQFGSAQGIGQ